MRSTLIFGATEFVLNRYLLARLASKATRKLHRPNTRLADTMNDVFERFSRASPIADAPYIDNVQQIHRVGLSNDRSLEGHQNQSAA
jgi:hypothetical protein